MKLRKLFAWLMTLVMLLGMVPAAHAELAGCNHDWDSGKWLRGEPQNCQDWKPKTYTCTICGATATNEECGPCVPGSKTWIRPQGSSCQEYGVWEITCKYCGEWLEGGEEPGPHKWRETIVEEPWCDVGGMKAMICSVCGEWQGNGTPLAPLGHDWGSWSWAHGEPACNEGGWQVRECKRCGRMEDRYVTGGKHDLGSWYRTGIPTCMKEGYMRRDCSRCDYYELDPIAKVAHEFGEWYVVTEPQVGVPGLEQRDCTYGCGTHEDREIPPLEEALELPGLELTLTLDSTPANGEYFVVGEQVVFTASWSNLSPFELFPFYVSIWPYEQPSRDSQDLPYSCSFDAEEPITTGMTGSHSMVTTVTEEDVARGGIYAMAFIWSSVHNGPEVEEVTTPFVTAPCAPVAGSDYATSIKLEVLDVPSVTAEWAGDVYTAKVKVTNTGDTAVSLYSYTFVDANGNSYPNAILYDWNKYQTEPIYTWLPAGESLTTDVEFAVTQEGIQAGELRFNLVQYAVPWYVEVDNVKTDIPSDIELIPEGVIVDYGKYDEETSATVEIVVPINQGAAEFDPEGLTVTKTASAGDYSNPCKPGDVVTFTITVTNNTGVELLDVEITDPIKGGNEDSIVDIIPSMQPGESVTASFSYTVTEEDATVGVEGFENTAYATGYTADGTQVSGTSETIFVWCVIEHGLTFFKSIDNVPANGVFFVPGETIVFKISMFNHTPYPLYNIILNDPLCQDQYIYDEINDMSYLYFGELYPEGNAMGESTSATVTVSYVVTEADAEAGSVTNTAEVTYQTWYGKDLSDSASVTVKCGKASDAVVLEKIDMRSPANGEYYVPGEVIKYGLTVRSTEDNPLQNIIIYDPLKGGDQVVFGPADTWVLGAGFDYTVTEADAQRGYIENTGYATFTYQNTGEDGTVYSNTLTLPCGFVKDAGLSGALSVTKSVTSTPANGSYYVPGEEIQFSVTVQNNMDKTLDIVVLTDPLSADFFHELLDIPGGATDSRTLSYTVTEFDAELGSVINYAYAVVYVDDQPTSLTSNSVTAPCGFPEGEDPFGVITALEVTKEVESLPLNGLYYTEGETVAYRITYVNIGETPLTDVMIYDALAGMTEIASAETLDVGESRFCVFNYTVTAEDVARGYIPNTAVGQFEIDGYLNAVHSDTVVVDTDGQPDPEIPEGILPPSGTIDTDTLRNGDAYCVRTITGRDNVSVGYETSFCTEHADTQASILAMNQVGKTPEMQMQVATYAVALWRSEVEKLYQDIFTAADPMAKATVMVEYIRFLTEVANYEALLKNLHPDQPALAAKKIAAMWEDKCVTLCYEMHATAAQRKDSLLSVTPATGAAASECACATTDEVNGKKTYTQSYCPVHGFPFGMIDMLLQGQDTAEAWTMIRQIWSVELSNAYNKAAAKLGVNSALAMAEYNALTQWMMAREASLIALYPENPEVVAQTMVKLIMDRVNDLCQVTK